MLEESKHGKSWPTTEALTHLMPDRPLHQVWWVFLQTTKARTMSYLTVNGVFFLCLARSPEGSGSTWEVGLKSQSATCCAVTGGPANHPCWVGPTPRMNPIGGSFLESSWAQGLGGPGTCTPLRGFSVGDSAFHPASRLSRRQCQQYLHVPSI